MKISAKTDYACRALLELSLHWPNPEPMQINTISKNRKIPLKFLVHIMIQLKQIGYAHSLRGQKGGYILAKAPKEIILSEVLNSFGEISIAAKNESFKIKKSNTLQTIWDDADMVLLNYFNNINYDELARRERSLGNIAMYAI